MKPFRFGIMGAGGIAGRFAGVISRMEDVTVAAVASKSREKAEGFVSSFCPSAVPFDSYEHMLESEKPDAVYIATTPDSHFALTKLCLTHGVPVLCEKAMFVTGKEAAEAFALSKEKGVFAMEALWSRFLPANKKAKEWLDMGKIGKPVHMEIRIGFPAPSDPALRYFSPTLCGGATTDITVYAYELARFYIEKPIKTLSVTAVRSESGVDATDLVSIGYGDMTAALATSFEALYDNAAVIFGTKGKIVVPNPHCASEAILTSADGNERFRDEGPDGFTYEIEETVRCIRAGLTESPVVPHALTKDCADLFDRICRAAGVERPTRE